jgi:hypothetical protein
VLIAWAADYSSDGCVPDAADERGTDDRACTIYVNSAGRICYDDYLELSRLSFLAPGHENMNNTANRKQGLLKSQVEILVRMDVSQNETDHRKPLGIGTPMTNTALDDRMHYL